MSDPQASPPYGADTGADYVPHQNYVAPETAASDPRGPSRTGPHLASLVLCLLLTPAALVGVDYGLVNGWGRAVMLARNDTAPTQALIGMGVAAGALLVVALLGRLSGLGPLVAGLVWGGLPTVAFALVPFTSAKRILDLPDVYDQFGFGLTVNTAVFPVVAGVLVGVGLAGRWRRAKPTQP